MALYVPAGARRRRTTLIAVAAVVTGVVIGFLAGRTTAPTAADQVRSVQGDARQTTAGLRVISLHDEAGATTPSGATDRGTQLVLDRTKEQLADELHRAMWITKAERSRLRSELDRLAARTDRSTASFGQATDALAAHVEEAFGTTG